MRAYISQSRVEQKILQQTGALLICPPVEKIAVIQVPHFPALGKLTALRFIEWLQMNPEGVISLPTGKTPEYFIKWTNFFLNHWTENNVQQDLADWGIDIQKKPNMQSFYFVQIDEFYPMNPAQENSFSHYINRFYFNDFGLNKERALLMDSWFVGAPVGKNLGDVFMLGHIDLSLRYRQVQNERERQQQQALYAVDQMAMEYEEKIKALGGIGFFLGGIGPDGHIGFNIRGSDHLSTTRLAPINYETAAAAAVDLGGIEIARKKVVVSIGLHTITQNQTATAIIIAAGANKANLVRDAVEKERSILYPASALQVMPNARFYVTSGAACLLQKRLHKYRAENVSKIDEWQDQVIIDAAVTQQTSLDTLTEENIRTVFCGDLLLKSNCSLKAHASRIEKNIKTKIGAGLDNYLDTTFLHTAPHHDDIMLGYLPFVVHLVRSARNTHYFATMTSGFTSVSNEYALKQINQLEQLLDKNIFDQFIQQGCFAGKTAIKACSWLSEKNSEVYHYLDGVAAGSIEQIQEAESSRLLRNFVELYRLSLHKQDDVIEVKKRINELKQYFLNSYPGRKDSETVQVLKGMIREWEEELLWGHLGSHVDHIYHLRLGFYTGDIFTQKPEFERDIKPIINLLEKSNPDIVTVAFDPEGSGPDTHYKVLQATAQALQFHAEKHPKKKVTVWGYRNVWFRFHPAEANIFVPVSMNSLAILNRAFQMCFGSQRAASFPSYEYDGPFCDLAQKVMVEQYTMLRTLLGEHFFYNNSVPRLRATHGFCFLKSMTLPEFFKEAAVLKEQMETAHYYE